MLYCLNIASKPCCFVLKSVHGPNIKDESLLLKLTGLLLSFGISNLYIHKVSYFK
nr:MAG TPA: hypothetical protein [Caudoviricetes sp.]